jgi:hypothetical protein
MDVTLEEVAELQKSNAYINTWTQSTDNAMGVFQNRFQQIKPLFDKLTNIVDSGANKENEYHSSTSSGGHPSKVNDSLVCMLKDLEEKIKLLENGVAGTVVQMGNILFQSFEDLLSWVQVKIPKGRFGLTVDGHSFLEFFTLSGYIDTEAGTTTLAILKRRGFQLILKLSLWFRSRTCFQLCLEKEGQLTLRIQNVFQPSQMATSGTMDPQGSTTKECEI